jgi:hypothetical protein
MHDDDGVAGVFKNPPLRRGGFNLDWGVAPEPYGPGGIAATLGRREGISVTHGGIATLRVTTGPTGLGWGMERYAGGQPSINPTALAELTFEFCRFYAAALRAGGVDSVDRSYRLIIPRHPNPLRLTSGHRPLGGDYLRAYDLAAPLEEEVGPVATATPCELVAGKLLGRLYEYFGMGRTLNPYLDPETGDLVPNRILALDGSGL